MLSIESQNTPYFLEEMPKTTAPMHNGKKSLLFKINQNSAPTISHQKTVVFEMKTSWLV
jgi:hypothetical protein